MAHDDEPRFNTTLLEMLRKDFQINLGDLDGALPTDQSGIDVNGIWDRVRREIRDAPGFEVIEDVVLGHFSFAKYLMWKDFWWIAQRIAGDANCQAPSRHADRPIR